MPLITCPDCNNQVSDMAPACPQCGRPINPKGVPVPQYVPPPKLNPKYLIVGCASVVAVLSLLFMIGMITKLTDTGSSTPRKARESTSTPSNNAPELYVDAVTLFNEYQNNEVAADKKYRGRRIGIYRNLDGIRKDFMDNVYLTLKTPNQFMSVRAEMAKEDADRVSRLSPNDQVSLTCTGAGMVIGSPSLKDCTFR